MNANDEEEEEDIARTYERAVGIRSGGGQSEIISRRIPSIFSAKFILFN